MRGSLDKPRNKKAAQQTLEKAHTKKAKEVGGPSFSEGQTPPDHGNQQDDANINAIFLSAVPRDTFDKEKRLKLKPIRGRLDPNQSQKLKVGVQEGNTSMDAIVVPNMLSLDKTKSNSSKENFERLKLTPSRGGRNETQTRVGEDGENGSPNMDAMSLPNMLRFLETEETLLTQLQSKMSAELSRLQVEEHVFLHTLKILGQKHASTNKVQDQQETSSGDQDFIAALNEALMENGESVPSNEDKGEGTSEE